MKISSTSISQKSFTEVIQMKSKLAYQTLKEISVLFNLGFSDEEKSRKLDTNKKAANREKARKLKAMSMNQYEDFITNYNSIQSKWTNLNEDLSGICADKETCSIYFIDKAN